MTPKQFQFLKKAMARSATYAKKGATAHVGQVASAAKRAFRPKAGAFQKFAKRAGNDLLNYVEKNPKKTLAAGAAVGGGAIAAQQQVHINASFDNKKLSAGVLQSRVNGNRQSRLGVVVTKELRRPKKLPQKKVLFHLSAGRHIEPVKRGK